MEKIKRETPNSLFKAIMKMARESGHFKAIDEILDSDSAFWSDEKNNRPITSELFDIEFSVDFGSAEGIHIIVSISGFPFGIDEGKQRFSIGLLVTMRRDFDSMALMGKACGILQWFAREYANQNLDRFTPEPKENK